MPRRAVAEVAQRSAPVLSPEALIHGLLRQARVKQLDIAARAGASESMVSRVVRGLSRSSDGRIEAAIAAAVGRPVDELFPPREAAAAA